MKIFLVTLLLCFLVKVSIQESKSLLDLLGVESRIVPVEKRDDEEIIQLCKTTKKPGVCKSCSELDICNYGTIDCPKEQPFCVESALGDYCSDSTSDLECKKSAVKPIRCTSQGYFPDPFNCKVMHTCGEVDVENPNAESTFKFCPEGYVFSLTTKDCFRSARATDCITITCDPTKIFSRFGTNNLYYGRCMVDDKGDVTDVAVYKCTDGATFDGKTCKFACPRDGKFADSNNPNRYIFCYRPLTGGYDYYIEDCPSLTDKFDAKTSSCI